MKLLKYNRRLSVDEAMLTPSHSSRALSEAWLHRYACMHLMNGKGHLAQKDHIGANMECAMRQFQCLTTLYANLFLFLRVLPVSWSSLSDDITSPGLLDNLNRSICLYIISWVRAKQLLNLPFSRNCNFRAVSSSS